MTSNIPGVGIILGEFDLMGGHGFAISVENEESGTGGALVDGPDEEVRLLHGDDVRRLRTTPGLKRILFEMEEDWNHRGTGIPAV